MSGNKRNSVTLPTIGFISDTGYDLPDDLSAEEWRDAGLQIAKARGASQWWVGDWWAFGEARYGERKAIIDSDDWDGPAFQTCMNAALVTKAIETSRRREVLSFNHHAEVAALPVEWQEEALDEAVSGSFSVMRLRQRVKEIRAFLSQGWTPSQLERQAAVEAGETVVASKRNNGDGLVTDRALIDWADASDRMQLIDRQSDWGNPFELGNEKDPGDGDRATVIENYRWYLDRRPSLQRRLDHLRGKVLVCWCHPEPCHGDVLCERLAP